MLSPRFTRLVLTGWWVSWVTVCLYPRIAQAQEATAGRDPGYGPVIAASAGILFGAWLAARRIWANRDD